MEDEKDKKKPPQTDKEKELTEKKDSPKASVKVEKENIKEQDKKLETMEVHHVKHEENHRYSIKIFLYEFLIIFLAVTVSFFVENIREKYIDHHKELQYANSLVNDIKIDTVQLNSVITRTKNQLKGIDSLLQVLEKPKTDKHVNFIYHYSILYLSSAEFFTNTDRTITQLKNAGGLRLIQNKAVSDSIITYDGSVQDGKVNSDYCLKLFYDLSKLQKGMLDLKYLRLKDYRNLKNESGLKLLTSDDRTVDIFYNEVLYYASALNNYRIKLIKLKKQSTNLLETLKAEYDIE